MDRLTDARELLDGPLDDELAVADNLREWPGHRIEQVHLRTDPGDCLQPLAFVAQLSRELVQHGFRGTPGTSARAAKDLDPAEQHGGVSPLSDIAQPVPCS